MLGGWLLRTVPASVLTSVAMLLSAVAFCAHVDLGRPSLDHQIETLSLVLGGLGFGLAIAPVNAALLAHTADAVHGVASALLIVARMVGMLLGISALTTIGLRAFYDASDEDPAGRGAVQRQGDALPGVQGCGPRRRHHPAPRGLRRRRGVRPHSSRPGSGGASVTRHETATR